jgi:uncharacterized protein
MNPAGHLYRLQQFDLELQEKQQELTEVQSKLSDDRALVAVQSRLDTLMAQLDEEKKRQRSSEWELEDLQEKVRQITGKLYGGTTRNPKDLVNLEMELKGFRGQIKPKEDSLLKLMSQVEEIEARIGAAGQERAELKREWQERQETMGRRKGELETALVQLRDERKRLVQQVTPQALNIYERTRQARGHAVAKIERGECRGCHITVPTSQWQKAKAGDLIQCSSCGRILYLE